MKPTRSARTKKIPVFRYPTGDCPQCLDLLTARRPKHLARQTELTRSLEQLERDIYRIYGPSEGGTGKHRRNTK